MKRIIRIQRTDSEGCVDLAEYLVDPADLFATQARLEAMKNQGEIEDYEVLEHLVGVQHDQVQ